MQDGAFFCNSACEQVYTFIKGKRDREEEQAPQNGGEESILFPNDSVVLWEVLYRIPLKRLGLICSTTTYIRDVCRDPTFRNQYLRENFARLDDMFFELLDEEVPLQNTFVLWVRLAQSMPRAPAWDPDGNGARVFQTALLRVLPECVRVFVPEAMTPMQAYPGASGYSIDSAITWCAGALMTFEDLFDEIGECLEVLLNSTQATLSVRGIAVLRHLASIGVGTWFAQAYRLARHKKVRHFVSNPGNRTRLMKSAAKSSRSGAIEYMLDSGVWWAYVNVEVFAQCIANNHMNAFVKIMEEWQMLVPVLLQNGLALLQWALHYGNDGTMALSLLEKTQHMQYDADIVGKLINLSAERSEATQQITFDEAREALIEWETQQEGEASEEYFI